MRKKKLFVLFKITWKKKRKIFHLWFIWKKEKNKFLYKKTRISTFHHNKLPRKIKLKKIKNKKTNFIFSPQRIHTKRKIKKINPTLPPFREPQLWTLTCASPDVRLMLEPVPDVFDVLSSPRRVLAELVLGSLDQLLTEGAHVLASHAEGNRRGTVQR